MSREEFEKETGIEIESCITQDGIDPVVYKYIEWLEKRSGWVSVEERLPEYDSWFLAYYDSGNYSVVFFWAMSWDYLNKPLENGDYITHWRPLPTPPDEAKRG